MIAASTLQFATVHYICYDPCNIHELRIAVFKVVHALILLSGLLFVIDVVVSRLQCKNSASLPSPLNVTSHVSLAKRMPVHVQASAEAGATDAAEQPEKPKPVASIEDMPLESKQQMILEQRARMKLAKKLRQRRKRLVQKRRLRKKGRWPPSKMKKLKNV